MKLHYFRRKDKRFNFGDDLNEWLWPQILPNYFDDNHESVFVGMGTLINDLLPMRVSFAKQVIIFSTGVGYERPLTQVPPHWHIYCLRGPLSAQKLGVSQHLAIADGAILIRRYYQPTYTSKKTSFSFMPHVHHAIDGGSFWQGVCNELGFQYIDPCWSVERVLEAISHTEVLLAEAMHGAITADALRVPWVPIITSPRILPFKWRDWCSSIGVSYNPHYLPPLCKEYPRFVDKKRASRRTIQYWQFVSQSLQHWKKWALEHPVSAFQIFQPMSKKVVAKQLHHIAKTASPMLSTDAKIERLTVQLEEKFDKFKSDWGVAELLS